jgi:hypothetical protein
MAESKSLKKAVAAEVKDAQKDAKTGNVETVPEKKGGPTVDLPTGARSHPPA